MTIVLPLAANERLVGSAVLIATEGDKPIFATALHLLGESRDLRVAVPPHAGNLSRPQPYPVAQTPAVPAIVVATDPFADLALLAGTESVSGAFALPQIVTIPRAIAVGSEIVVLGYPFAPLGSFLETWTPGYVTAHAERQLAPGIAVDELVLSNVSHPGSSGSAVVGKTDGVLYGILRGALAPPEVLKIGDIPIATDTSVTFASSAHLLVELLVVARTMIRAGAK